MTAAPVPAVREIVLGRSSAVWQRLAREPALEAWCAAAIGHADLDCYVFTPADRVWVLSYSRVPEENLALLQRLGRAGVQEIVYVSSSSTIVSRLTQCYEYPRVKLQAESAALALPNARVLTIGLMHDDPAELPSGANIATGYAELAAFMRSPTWPGPDGRRRQLFGVVRRPPRHGLERGLMRAYGAAMAAAGSRPCLLRPIDLLLRALGMRWYGYTFLSNRLWISTTS